MNLGRAVRLVAPAAFLLCVAACDPVMGTGSGNPPDLSHYIQVNYTDQSVVVVLVAGYPAGDYQFNYNGYGSGALVLKVPVGWSVTVQCENHGTVPNSCSVVKGGQNSAPVDPQWSTPNPRRGLDPGQSASFEFQPTQTGSFRIASLVGGNEASGMWADLEVTSGGKPTLTGT
ncbi:MAG TPA: sulfocyanin-like copper-binding protein [Candidatus Saccharimonadales bacterium]|nr:sulfocyanin-like copper-binding protein [Candidatus Saccharimonadales bacterium]